MTSMGRENRNLKRLPTTVDQVKLQFQIEIGVAARCLCYSGRSCGVTCEIEIQVTPENPTHVSIPTP
jgi:hypothetical protein